MCWIHQRENKSPHWIIEVRDHRFFFQPIRHPKTTSSFLTENKMTREIKTIYFFFFGISHFSIRKNKSIFFHSGRHILSGQKHRPEWKKIEISKINIFRVFRKKWNVLVINRDIKSSRSQSETNILADKFTGSGKKFMGSLSHAVMLCYFP